VTLVGGGAGSSARFYVDRFATDNLVFNGNFKGNVRVLQDLVANLNFGGDVDRITLGGRVGSYASSDPVGSIVAQVAQINVAGRLLYLNTNSYFEALGSGDGVFWNDAIKTTSTGALSTGSYGKVVPNLQEVLPPAPPTPQTYTVPSAPGGFSSSWQNSPAGIIVSFTSSTNNGGLPVVYYEYTTDGGTNWRKFDNPTTTSATNLLLTVNSAGAPFVVGSPYTVAVRAVNALGATATPTTTVVVPPSAPLSFTAQQTALGATTIDISFNAPAGTGGAPVSYEYTTDGGTTWTAVAGPGPSTLTSQSGPGALPFVIGQTYQVTVRATNSAGAGPAFSPAASVFLDAP
jgi:titin